MPVQADRAWSEGYKGRRRDRNGTERYRRTYVPSPDTIQLAIEELLNGATLLERSFLEQRANIAEGRLRFSNDTYLKKWDKSCGQERIMWTVARKALEGIAEECQQLLTSVLLVHTEGMSSTAVNNAKVDSAIDVLWDKAAAAWDRPMKLRENLQKIRDVRV